MVIGSWRLILILSYPFSSPCHKATCTSHGAFPRSSRVGSDSPTSSSDGAPSMLPHTNPLPFIDDPEASSLSTSINGFRLDDRTTESITAYNWIHNHHNQGEK